MPNIGAKAVVPAASLCPPPQAYASYNTFTYETKVKKGETAFETVSHFRVAEREKNLAGKRLWGGIKACRSNADQKASSAGR